MKPFDNEEDIIKKCVELDEKAKEKPFLIYFLHADRFTFQLKWSSMYWGALSQGERFSIVKYGNIFFSQEEVEAARDRIFQ